MNGIKMNELYELISSCHEAEFEYAGTTYVLQPEIIDGKPFLVIWDCTPNNTKCIAKHEISAEGKVSNTDIDSLLSINCFYGKSFLEIERDVTVNIIY